MSELKLPVSIHVDDGEVYIVDHNQNEVAALPNKDAAIRIARCINSHEQQEAEIRRLRDALEHYADKSHWLDSNYDGEPDRPILYWNGQSQCGHDDINGYDIADAALKPVTTETQGSKI